MQIDTDTPLQWITRCADGSCIQVARHRAGILVRDSKDLDGPVLTFTAEQWAAFTAAVAAGEFAGD